MRRFLMLAFTMIILLFCTVRAPAQQRSKLGLSPEDQKKHDELMRSAQEHMSAASMAVRIAAVCLAAVLLWAAFAVLKNGLGMAGDGKLKGAPAYLLAACLALAGVALGVVGWLFAPPWILGK